MTKIRIRYRDDDPSYYPFVANLVWKRTDVTWVSRVAATDENLRAQTAQQVIKGWLKCDQAAHYEQ